MITRDALYDFVQETIDAAGPEDALYGAEVFRNLRTSVDIAEKIVRVETLVGQHCMTTEDHRKELNVETVIQSWVIPDVSQAADEETALDAATDTSFDMSRVIFEAIATDPSLGGRVCDSYFDVFETGYANLGSLRRGVTYLDGTINQGS